MYHYVSKLSFVLPLMSMNVGTEADCLSYIIHHSQCAALRARKEIEHHKYKSIVRYSYTLTTKLYASFGFPGTPAKSKSITMKQRRDNIILIFSRSNTPSFMIHESVTWMVCGIEFLWFTRVDKNQRRHSTACKNVNGSGWCIENASSTSND